MRDLSSASARSQACLGCARPSQASALRRGALCELCDRLPPRWVKAPSPDCRGARLMRRCGTFLPPARALRLAWGVLAPLRPTRCVGAPCAGCTEGVRATPLLICGVFGSARRPLPRYHLPRRLVTFEACEVLLRRYTFRLRLLLHMQERATPRHFGLSTLCRSAVARAARSRHQWSPLPRCLAILKACGMMRRK